MRPHGSRRITQFIVGPRFARTRSAMLLTMRVKPVARMSESDMRESHVAPGFRCAQSGLRMLITADECMFEVARKT